jgi:hypothetical protein
MYLRKEHLEPALNLINSPLWADIRRCLLERRPDAPVAADPIHTAAAKGFERKGYEQAMLDVEKLPFELPVDRADPFNRPAITETSD